MVAFPICKINLGLRIVSKRSDGFHNIDTCFLPVSLTDILEIVESKSLSFRVTGLMLEADPKDNLVMRAYHLVQKKFQIPPVQVHLHKIIPAGAGLGGGSSDAAFTILLLNELFELGLDRHQMYALAAHLGSDCSFFIGKEAALGSERGDVLRPISLSDKLNNKYIVIIKPPLSVSTAEAYAGVQLAMTEVSVEQALGSPLAEWKDVLVNDFESTVFKSYPSIAQIKNQLYADGAVYASMSGSGSSVYGIFENEPHLIKGNYKDCFTWVGHLGALR